MEYSSSTQMAHQMETGGKEVVTKEEVDDRYSLRSNAGYGRMQLESGKISKVKEEISTSKTERTECQQAIYVVKKIASGDAENDSGSMLLPDMPLPTSFCQRSTTDKQEEAKTSEFVDDAPVGMRVSPLANKVPIVTDRSVNSTSPLKLANKAKRLDTIVSTLFKMKNNGSAVRIESTRTATIAFAETGAIEHSIPEAGSEDHNDVCNNADGDENDEGSSKQQFRNELSGEKPFNSDVCKKKFTTSSDLTVHKRAHTGDRPFECLICHKRFTQTGHLLRHKVVHTGERPFQCDICDGKFTTSSHLTVHKRIHTGIKPFKCDVCKKCFTRSDNLVTHKRIHTGDKPFKCDICNKGCVTSSELNRHKRVHSGDKPYKCPICGVCFTRNQSLQKHKRRWHVDTNEDTQPDVSHLQNLPSSSPQSDASRESWPMEEFIITD